MTRAPQQTNFGSNRPVTPSRRACASRSVAFIAEVETFASSVSKESDMPAPQNGVSGRVSSTDGRPGGRRPRHQRLGAKVRQRRQPHRRAVVDERARRGDQTAPQVQAVSAGARPIGKGDGMVCRQRRGGVHVVDEPVEANPAKPPVRAMCKPLRLSASGCDDWLEWPACAQAQAGAGLPEQIRQAHAASAAACGVPRGQAALADPGIRAGHKRIAATLRAHGLHGASRRGGWCVTDQRAKAQRPHRTWCSARSPFNDRLEGDRQGRSGGAARAQTV